MKKAVVFGVFDLFHEGHKYFLSEAIRVSQCDELHVVLTTEHIVNLLKNKTPHDDYQTRKQKILEYCTDHPDLKCSVHVHESDHELGVYRVFKEINPQVVCFGYDQKGLMMDLTSRLGDFLKENRVHLETIQSFHPEKYKTSILENKKTDFLYD
jgi:cytidyltransferase-like protein